MNPINKSYFFGFDSKYGWGNRSYFTYYGEFGREVPWLGPLEAGVLAVVFIFSIVANTCLASIIIRFQELRTVTNFFILNLAFADILFAASIPIVIVTRIMETWVLGDILCRLLLYFQFVCGAVLLWTLTLISLERYRCIVLHPHRTRLQGQHALTLIIIIWLVFLVFFVPVALWFQVLEFPFGNNENIKVCTLIFPKGPIRISYLFISLTLLLTCIIPIIWLVYNYHAIFQKLLANEQSWQQQVASVMRKRLSAQFVDENGENIRNSDEIRQQKHYRTIKILILDVCCTLIMWLPIIIVMGLIHYDSSKNSDFFIHSHYFIAAMLIALANTCVNPLLYGFLNTSFRTRLYEVWNSCIGRRNGLHKMNSNPHIIESVESVPAKYKSLETLRSKVTDLFGSLTNINKNTPTKERDFRPTYSSTRGVDNVCLNTSEK